MTKVPRKTVPIKEITVGLIEDAARDFNAEVIKATQRIEATLPKMLFQEKHTTGRLWWKKTYYTYWRYSESRILQLPIDTLESGK